MPVMDMAFHSKQRMLAVARDPRDVCSGQNQGQFTIFGEQVKLPDDLRLKTNDSVQETFVTTELGACMEFWANAWASVLHEYALIDRFLVVRIEDLVIPDPATSNASHTILKRMMKHAGLSPSRDECQKQLEISHRYANSYMGHSYVTAESQDKLEHEVASYTGIVHEVMQAFGYNVDRYGLDGPRHPRVLVSTDVAQAE